jgi:NAD(P)-dependent dehydrogenase (short-subunit alcohol dehydrogenase family)
MTEYALVTGASRNIGKAICARLKADGYRVIMLDIIEPEDPSLGEFMRVDLASQASTAQSLAWATDKRDITRLVNCAGIVALATLADVSFEEFDRTMAVNVRSYIQVTQAVLPAMRKQRFGRVVNIASRAVRGQRRLTSYSASKAAVVGMTKTWALEEAGNGVTVNAIAPGPIDTDMLREAQPEGSASRAALLASIPVGRVGQPDDIAQAVSFFLDRRSGFVTGQLMYVCGGLTVG